MASMINFCLLFFILTGNYLGHVDALLKSYISLISNLHKYYSTSSVFFILSRNDRQSLQECTMVNFLCQEFSRNGVSTLMINFDTLDNATNFHQGRIVRPLMVVMLKSMEDIIEFNESIQNINTAYPVWLLIFVDKFSTTLCEYCNHPIGNMFRLRFDTEMLIMCCHDKTLKEWWSVNANRTEIADFATWNKNNGLTLLSMKGLYARRSDGLNGAGLRVAIVTKSTLVHDYGHRIGGFGGTILRELQRVMNFTISETLRETGYGSGSPTTKSWSGVVGQVAQGKADLGIAEFTITNSRLNVVDFTWPLMISRNRLYIKVPDGSEVRWYSYFEVFRSEIWMMVIVLVITTPILLTVININRGSISLTYLMSENYLHVWGIFCQEGISQFPVQTPLRIAYTSIFVTALVVSAAYSASLISFLTVSSATLPFTTLTGFAKDKSYKLIVIQNSSNYDLFAASTDSVLTTMMTMMKPWKHLPITLNDAFKQVCTEKVAFITDEIAKMTMPESINCKIAVIESGRADHLAMILSPNSQYTGVVNYHIQRFQDNGMLNRFKRRYFLKSNTAENTHPVVSIWAIIPILSLLAGGIILASIVFVCEQMYCRKQKRHRYSDRPIFPETT